MPRGGPALAPGPPCPFRAHSTWQIFSALGFYPLQVGSGNYVIGSPLFTKVTIHLDNGRSIVVNAPDNGRDNVYVQSLRVDGRKWNKVYVTQDQLSHGAVLDFTMGPRPSDWGSGPHALPAGLTAPGQTPAGLTDTTGPGLGTATAADGTDGTDCSQHLGHPGRLPDRDADRPLRLHRQRGAATRTAAFYTLTSGTAASSADPSAWTLQGSRDGAHWTTPDSRSGQTFTDRQQTRPFEIAHPGSYSSYRLVVTATAGGSPASLAEVELLHRG